MSSEIIAPLLTKLFNQCFSKGIFPEPLKLAEIKPIYKKKGPKECCSNYTPISLLAPFSKILEKCIYTCLYHFFQKHNLLIKTNLDLDKTAQHHMPFQRYAITSFKIEMLAKFLDLEKAFDTIHHEVLLLKLQIYGVRGLAFDLFQNYLNHRKHYTVINGRKSIYNYSNCEIP